MVIRSDVDVDDGAFHDGSDLDGCANGDVMVM
jgi:hypothetical protein